MKHAAARIWALSLVLAATASGGDETMAKGVITVPVGEKTTLTFGMGYLQATADEIVYGGPGPEGGELSRLNWDIRHALVFNFGAAHELTPRLQIYANGAVSGLANSNLADYDWLGADARWTDRSVHEDTDLEHYFQVDTGLGFRLIDKDPFTLSLLGGFRYTDIAWAAYGGDFVYSTAPEFSLFRDDRGSFPDGELGISYQQKLPVFYLGPSFTWNRGRLTVHGTALAGVTADASDRDRHWSRDLIFIEEFKSQAFFGGNLGADFAFKSNLDLFLEALYEKYPLMKGTTEQTDISNGQVDFFGQNSAGANLETWQVRAGVKVCF